MIHAAEVVKKGDRMRTNCAWFMLLFLPLMLLMAVFDLKPWFLIIVFLLPMIIVGITQTYYIQKWRIWALTNVDNPALFKKWAQQLWLIPIGSKLDKFEFQTKKYKQKWAALQHRFDEEVKVQPVEIPSNGMLLERSILVDKAFGFSRKNLFIYRDKMVVEQKGEYYWDKIQDASIDFTSDYDDVLGRVYDLSFKYLGKKIVLPIHPKSDLALIERVVTAKTTCF
ncbi:MAG: hypothetical protein H6607_00300 [Flavobacteriales bacterium]|nr:hypothetical protein [Flavobacteriales bacterium]